MKKALHNKQLRIDFRDYQFITLPKYFLRFMFNSEGYRRKKKDRHNCRS